MYKLLVLERILQTQLSLETGIDRIVRIVMVVRRLQELESGIVACRGIAYSLAISISYPFQEVHGVVVRIAYESDLTPVVVDQVEDVEDVEADLDSMLFVGAAEPELMHQLEVQLMIPGCTQSVTFCIFSSTVLQIAVGINKGVECIAVGRIQDHRLCFCPGRDIRQRRVAVDDIARCAGIDQAIRAARLTAVEEVQRCRVLAVPCHRATQGCYDMMAQIEVGITQLRVVRRDGGVIIPVTLHRVTDTIGDVFRHPVSIGYRPAIGEAMAAYGDRI